MASPDTKKKTGGPKATAEWLERRVKELGKDLKCDEHNRIAAIEDLKFALGGDNQWKASVVADRKADNRPYLSVNLFPQYISQITGDIRHNRPRAKITPGDSQGDIQIARIREGIISDSEYQSNSDYIYVEAATAMVTCGYGAWRILTRHTENNPFIQEFYDELIDNPFTVKSDINLAKLREKIKETGTNSFLVSADNKQLLGIISRRDIDFITDETATVASMMTPKEKLIVARPEITPEQARQIFRLHKVEKIPLVDDNFQIKGLITQKDVLIYGNNLEAAKDAKGRLLVGAAIGVGDDFLERAQALIEAEADVLVLDIAHGHSFNELNAIAKIKEKFPAIELIGGNVATAEGAKALIAAGADAVKVGIGPGRSYSRRKLRSAPPFGLAW